MEIYQLRSFLKIKDTKSLQRAADELCMTPGAISKQLKALEEELGLRLFDRTSAGMLITKDGEEIANQAVSIVAGAAALTQCAQKLSGRVSGTIVLGTILDPEFIRLGDSLTRFVAKHPGVECQLRHGVSGWVLNEIENDHIDVGYYLGPVNDEKFEAVVLSELSYKLACPKGWASELHDAKPHQIASAPWVGAPPESSQTRLVQKVFSAYNTTINPVIEVDQESSMQNLVSSGTGLCFIRSDIADDMCRRDCIGIIPGWEQIVPLVLVFKKEKLNIPSLIGISSSIQESWIK